MAQFLGGRTKNCWGTSSWNWLATQTLNIHCPNSIIKLDLSILCKRSFIFLSTNYSSFSIGTSEGTLKYSPTVYFAYVMLCQRHSQWCSVYVINLCLKKRRKEKARHERPVRYYREMAVLEETGTKCYDTFPVPHANWVYMWWSTWNLWQQIKEHLMECLGIKKTVNGSKTWEGPDNVACQYPWGMWWVSASVTFMIQD